LYSHIWSIEKFGKTTGTLKLIFGKRKILQEEFVRGEGGGIIIIKINIKKKSDNFQTLILSLTIYLS